METLWGKNGRNLCQSHQCWRRSNARNDAPCFVKLRLKLLTLLPCWQRQKQSQVAPVLWLELIRFQVGAQPGCVTQLARRK
jgi:hypothetical protein